VSQASIVALTGRESLLVYSVHLMMLYGKFGTFTFAERVRGSFGYIEATAATLILLGLMCLLAWGWQRIKRGPPLLKRATQAGVLTAFVAVFFFGPR
jgi:hypothetical protein